MAGGKLLAVEERRGDAVGAAEHGVAGEFVGDALGGDGGVELHDAAVGSHHLHHQLLHHSKTFQYTVSHGCIYIYIYMNKCVSVFIQLEWSINEKERA